MRKKLTLIAILLLLVLEAGCTSSPRKSKAQYQQGAIDSPQVSEQRNIKEKEQQLLQERENLIQTMSLEELI